MQRPDVMLNTLLNNKIPFIKTDVWFTQLDVLNQTMGVYNLEDAKHNGDNIKRGNNNDLPWHTISTQVRTKRTTPTNIAFKLWIDSNF